MREIKVRVKNAFTDEWLYYNILDFEGMDSSGGLGWAINTMSEYTGLHDKNEVEIYEGDIVKYYDESVWGIYWGDAGWYMRNKSFFGEKHLSELGLVNKACEVIGNIYKNPELLEVKDA